MLETTQRGWYCAPGRFYVDPTSGVDRAIITHAHSDHARAGSGSYLCHEHSVGLLRERVGAVGSIRGVRYGETVDMDGVKISLHPAGHILGSAQVRMEYRGQVWVVSGDYKTVEDPTCARFEPVRCHHFVTESTFALPVYRWRSPGEILEEVQDWWLRNQATGRTSLVWAYSLGKAQRLLAGLEKGLGPVLVHAAIQNFLPHYREAGVDLGEYETVDAASILRHRGKALVVAPPGATGAGWLSKAGDVAESMASGWMLLRGPRRRQALDRGFALSDHADWPGLLEAIRATSATKVWVTHGYASTLARWLTESGVEAEAVASNAARTQSEDGA